MKTIVRGAAYWQEAARAIGLASREAVAGFVRGDEKRRYGPQQLPWVRSSVLRSDCVAQALRILIGNYAPPPSTRVLESRLGVKRREWAWSHSAANVLSDFGLEVSYYTTLDTDRFLADEAPGSRLAAQHLRQAMKRGVVHNRALEFDEVRSFFQHGYHVALVLDANRLVGREGYRGHMVVLYKIGSDAVVCNARYKATLRIPLRALMAAWTAPGTDRDALIVDGRGLRAAAASHTK